MFYPVRAVVSWFVVCILSSGTFADEPVRRLAGAHAHNDYEHHRPLLDALDQGFCSVEADIFLKEKELFVAHTPFGIKPGRTLRKLYLEPLKQRVEANRGRVHAEAGVFELLIDIKTDGAETYAALAAVLAEYSSMIEHFRDGKEVAGPVRVIISGNCDRASVAPAKGVRWASIDGRVGDLDGDAPANLIPWVSASWSSQFRWKGEGAMPEAEVQKLRQLVERAHRQGRKVRFWAAPDHAASWQVQKDAGVDLINTDRLAELGQFLRAKK